MLDAMTAVSLAGNIVQFVEFSSEVVSKTREMSKSPTGTTQDIQRSEIVIRDLLSLCENLKNGLLSTGPGDESLQDLCNGCISLGQNMVKRLSRLKVQEGDPNWTVVRKAAAAVWSKKELDELSRQLASFRSQLELHVLVSFREHFDLTILSQTSAIDKSSQRIVSALRYHHRVFTDTAEEQMGLISGLHQDLVKVASNEHETTRAVIIEAVRSGSASEGKTRRPSRTEAWVNTQEEEVYLKEKAEDRILQSLLFPSIRARYSQVTKAHAKTFEWIFKRPPDDQQQPWSSFKEWLQSGNGIYWLNGKAGSGKSTLMRYLYDHRYTRTLLESWSDPMPLSVASFFFWNSGTSDQKSQMGLLRALLHELLSTHRSLIPTILPNQWSEEYVSPTEYYQDFHWDLNKMRDSFNTLRRQDDLRICLFIDGLDEYEGDRDGTYTDIATLFAEIATSPNIKICLSSRPWLVFEDAFQQGPNLRLQDLTSDDIRQYVEDKLYRHSRMAKLRKNNPRNAEELIYDIVSKASGVFLWVKLVVKSLLDGLTNRDRICDLQRRLELLPGDLEDLYHHMLFKHIDPFYREQSSQIFQIFRSAKDSARGASEGVDLLTLAFADEDDQDLALTAGINEMTRDTLLSKCSDMEGRLKSRCAGLLEVSATSKDPLEKKVDFLHRTVRNFLEIPEIWQLQLALPGHPFDPNECLAKSYLLQLKTSPLLHPASGTGDDFKEAFRIATIVLEFARKSKDLTGNPNLQLLDALDGTMQSLWASKPRKTFDMNSHAIDIRKKHCWACYAERRHKASQDFLSVAVSYGLKEYVGAKLVGQKFASKRSQSSLLYYIVDAAYPPESEMVSLLLQHGADPNKDLGGQTMWQALLIKLAKPSMSVALFGDRFLRDTWMEICMLLIEGGADCNAICLGRVEKDYSNVVTGFDKHQFQVRAFTPLYLFSRSGLYPHNDIEASLFSRGAVLFHTEIESYDREDVERQALEAAAKPLSKPSRRQPAKQKPAAKKVGKWRRKWTEFMRPDLTFVKAHG